MTKRVSQIILILGILLFASALALLVVNRIAIPGNKDKAAAITEEMKELMPEVQNGYPDGKGDTVMPSIELDGVDFVGIIEIPAYNVCLPVANKWSAKDVSKYPHRFDGSIYDSSLIIGGSDNEGQFDFMKNISTGDTVYFTDTLGARYTYAVSEILITEDVSYEKLSDGEGELSFFARNSYGFEYTVVRCKLD